MKHTISIKSLIEDGAIWEVLYQYLSLSPEPYENWNAKILYEASDKESYGHLCHHLRSHNYDIGDKPEKEYCLSAFDDHNDGITTKKTECGHVYIENSRDNYKYCPYCGKHIKIKE
jgi:hypothetical protein